MTFWRQVGYVVACAAIMWSSLCSADGREFTQHHTVIFNTDPLHSALQTSMQANLLGTAASRPRIESIDPIFLTTVVRGEGRLHITLDQRWNKRWKSYAVQEDGTQVEDLTPMVLLRGHYAIRYRSRSASRPIAAAVYREHGEYVLNLSFKGKAGKHRSLSYDLSAPLDLSLSGRGRASAEIKRIRMAARSAHSCEAEALPQSAKMQSESPRQVSALVNKVVELRTVADNSYYLTNGAGSNALIAAAVNAADAIYRNDISAQFDIIGQHVYTGADPYTASTDAGTLLNDFSITNPPRNTFGESDLAHLFTGRDLDGSTIGIAWVGALCALGYNSGLSQHLGNATERALVFAHEVGHNFGANHDGGGVTGYIMSPFLDVNATGFSPGSKTEMATEMASAGCLADAGGPAPSPSPSPSASRSPSPSPSASPAPSVAPSPDPGGGGDDPGSDPSPDEPDAPASYTLTVTTRPARFGAFQVLRLTVRVRDASTGEGIGDVPLSYRRSSLANPTNFRQIAESETGSGRRNLGSENVVVTQSGNYKVQALLPDNTILESQTITLRRKRVRNR